MNISKLTIERLQAELEKSKKIREAPLPMAASGQFREPVNEAKDISAEKSIDPKSTDETNLNNPFLGDQEKYLLSEKNKPKEVTVYDAVTLSNLFRNCKHDLTQEQVRAFEGIENVREYIQNMNCNCSRKLAHINQYYRDFVMGNMETDLFPTMKKISSLDKIVFLYENQKIFET